MSSDTLDTVLTVKGIGKTYRLGMTTGAGYRYKSLREEISKRWARGDRETTFEPRILQALQDVSFEVNQGERVGIIGRNGAGKSTLLKVLAGITAPSEGQAEIHGRVGALLEVGSGFHPELSGRDNIFLNGAILGMPRREILAKMDQITEFSGIGKFLETPVKRYSSGMYLRLAFAVAAHLEPDILLVDEILAVGDAEFQKKCLGRMEEIGQSGRTVVFISHSMPAILRLCERVILLDGGRVIADGRPAEVIRDYLDSGFGTTAERAWDDPESAPGDDVARLKGARVRSRGAVTEEIDIRQPIEIEVEYTRLSGRPEIRPSVHLYFYNEDGDCLFLSNDFNNLEWRNREHSAGSVRARCCIPGNFLAEGRVFVWVGLSSYNPALIHFHERDVIVFQVVDRSSGDGVRGENTGKWPGVVRPMLEWEVEKDSHSGHCLGFE